MKKLITICLAVTMILAISSMPVIATNLLTDPGFDVNPLGTISNVLNNFATYQGTWCAESATITGVNGGVTPYQGVGMLRMTNAGGNATQAYQVTNVSALISSIDLGTATVNLNAMFNFNADANVPAAHSGLWLYFFTGDNWSTMLSDKSILANKVLDDLPGNWEFASVGGTIPVSTRWIVSQVLYSNASLQGYAGYVDSVELTIVPEPATILLLTLGGLLLRKSRS